MRRFFGGSSTRTHVRNGDDHRAKQSIWPRNRWQGARYFASTFVKNIDVDSNLLIVSVAAMAAIATVTAMAAMMARAQAAVWHFACLPSVRANEPNAKRLARQFAQMTPQVFSSSSSVERATTPTTIDAMQQDASAHARAHVAAGSRCTARTQTSGRLPQASKLSFSARRPRPRSPSTDISEPGGGDERKVAHVNAASGALLSSHQHGDAQRCSNGCSLNCAYKHDNTIGKVCENATLRSPSLYACAAAATATAATAIVTRGARALGRRSRIKCFSRLEFVASSPPTTTSDEGDGTLVDVRVFLTRRSK